MGDGVGQDHLLNIAVPEGSLADVGDGQALNALGNGNCLVVTLVGGYSDFAVLDLVSEGLANGFVCDGSFVGLGILFGGDRLLLLVYDSHVVGLARAAIVA